MPTVSLQTLSALNSGTHAGAGVSAVHDGEGFQSLLGIDAAVPGDKDTPKNPAHKNTRTVDATAAAVDAPEKNRNDNAPPRADNDRETETPSDKSAAENTADRRPLAQRLNAAKPVERPIRPSRETGHAGDAGPQDASAQKPSELKPEEVEAVLAEIVALQGLPVTDTVSFLDIKLAPGSQNAPDAPIGAETANPAPQLPATSGQPTTVVITPAVSEQFSITAETVPQPLPVRNFLTQLERLVQKLEAITDAGSEANPADSIDGETPSQPGGFKDAAAALRSILRQIVSGDISPQQAVKEIHSQLSEVRRLLPAIETLPASLEKFSGIKADAKPEAVPFAAPTARIVVERAETIFSTPQYSAASVTAATAAANAGGNADADAGRNNGNSGSQNAPLPAAARAGNADAQLKTAPGADFARLVTRTEPRPVAEQVMFHIRTALKDGSSHIRIQLEPETLGKLDIKLHVDAAGKTGVTITVDNKNTLDLLQRDARGLERALNDAGLTADSGNLNFNLKGGDQQRQETAQAAETYQKIMPEEEPKPVNVLTRSYVVNLAEGLDIRI